MMQHRLCTWREHKETLGVQEIDHFIADATDDHTQRYAVIAPLGIWLFQVRRLILAGLHLDWRSPHMRYVKYH